MEKMVLAFFEKFYNNCTESTILNTIDVDEMDLEFCLDEFCKIFEIENTESFNLNEYFYKLSFINKVKTLFGLKIKKYEKKPPITIAHMIEVAKRKEWFEPNEEIL